MNRVLKSQFVKTIFIRLLSSLLTLFLLVSFLFFIIRLSPGNPTDKYVSAKLGSELSERIAEKFSLNQPVADQYFAFVSNIFKGDLGVSYNYRLPVFEVIWEYFSFTLIFASISFIIQLSMSIWLAIRVVRKQNKRIEQISTNLSLFVYSIPAFVLGVTLIYIFSVHLNILPISGLKSLDHDELSFSPRIFDQQKEIS